MNRSKSDPSSAAFSDPLLLVAMFDQVKTGQLFKSPLPLHVTVLHWFEVGDMRQEFDQRLRKLARDYPPIELKAKEKAMFGPEFNVPVRKVDSPVLVSLHNLIVGLVLELGGGVTQEYSAKKYRPHVTYVDKSGFAAGGSVRLAALQLFSKTPSGDKLVQAVYSFGGEVDGQFG